MDTTYSADGLLHHQFFGDYSAHIVLDFKNNSEASRALNALNQNLIDDLEPHYNAVGEKVISLGWVIGITDPYTLHIECGGELLNKVTKQLVSYGACEKKMHSIARSLDFGEPFEVKVPHVYVDHPKQTLFSFCGPKV